MRYLHLLLVAILFSLNSYAQRKEDIINKVLSETVSTSSSYYFLYEDAYPQKFSDKDRQELHGHFDASVDPAVLDELFRNSMTDTVPYGWNCDRLPRSRCLSADKITSYVFPAPVLQLDSTWSTRKMRKEADKQLEEYFLKRRELPIEKRTAFYFSRPVLSSSGEYALVQLGSATGETYGHWCIYLFRKSGQSWERIGKGSCESR